MPSEIVSYFVQIIRQSGTIDIAKAEFRRLLSEDAVLQERYRLWCEETGHSPRSGFEEFCEEFIDSQQSIWDSFDDFDE